MTASLLQWCEVGFVPAGATLAGMLLADSELGGMAMA